MEKKILGIILIFIILIIIFNKESFITTGLDKIKFNNNVPVVTKEIPKIETLSGSSETPSANQPVDEQIIPSTTNIIPENVPESRYSYIFGTFIGIIFFIFCVVKYKLVIEFIKNIPTNIKNLFTSNNDSDDITEYDDTSFGGKMLYLGGYDINDYSD